MKTDFEQFQIDAARTFEKEGKFLDLLHCSVGACTEAAELADNVKRHVYYGAPLDIPNIVEEIGDMMVYGAALLNFIKEHGYTDGVQFNLKDCMEANVNKRKIRFPEKFTREAAIDRDLPSERKSLEDDC